VTCLTCLVRGYIFAAQAVIPFDAVLAPGGVARYDNFMAKQSFSRHLQESREAVGLSQFELAHRGGIPQRQISAIETGEKDQVGRTL